MLYPVPIRNDQPCLGAFTFSVEKGLDGAFQATNKIGALANGQAIVGLRFIITEDFVSGAATDLTYSIGIGAYTKNGVTTAAQPALLKAVTDLDALSVGDVVDVTTPLFIVPAFDGEQLDVTLTFAGGGGAATWTAGKLKGFVALVEQI